MPKKVFSHQLISTSYWVNMKVTEILHIYKKDKGDVAALTRLYSAISNLNCHIGDMNIQCVDVRICRKYAEARKKQKVKRHGEYHSISDSTIARELGVLKAAANHALKWRTIKTHQMPNIEIPKNLPKGKLWLFKDEWMKLSLYANNIMFIYIPLLYQTASRRQAIEKLEWSQVDFTNKVIHLNKPGQVVTKKRRPSIPMGELYEPMKKLYSERKNNYVLGSGADRYKEFIGLVKKAGVYNLPERDGRPAGKITPHVLRHTRATHLLEAGMSIYKVAQLLGDNPTTVERVYAHACTKSLEEELNKYN